MAKDKKVSKGYDSNGKLGLIGLILRDNYHEQEILDAGAKSQFHLTYGTGLTPTLFIESTQLNSNRIFGSI